MAPAWKLWLAPILNDEGMGADHPYLWPSQVWCDVALEVSPHGSTNPFYQHY
jgi:hypothetical protein